jgi:hypothetical protein
LAFNSPFAPLPANTIAFTAGVSAQSRAVAQADFGFNQWPPQLRIFNNGTVIIWIWFSPAQVTLVIPVPGTTTVGTPSLGIPIVPGIVEVYSLSNFQGGALWISDISTSASQTYFLTPGEGL